MTPLFFGSSLLFRARVRAHLWENSVTRKNTRIATRSAMRSSLRESARFVFKDSRNFLNCLRIVLGVVKAHAGRATESYPGSSALSGTKCSAISKTLPTHRFFLLLGLLYL